MEYVLESSRARRFTQDQRAELLLGALALGVVVLIYAILFFIIAQGWKSFSYNGLHWFGGGGRVEDQLHAMFGAGQAAEAQPYEFHAWPLIWSTFLIVGACVICSLIVSLLAARFLVEFAPKWLQKVLAPVIRLLASVPSVIYGLIAVIVIVPFIGNHLISEERKES